MEKNPWKKLSSKIIYDNPWITVEEDQVINPGGGNSLYGKVLFKNLAIGIVPLDDQGNTWLVGQWRYTLNEYTWEIPMGGGEKSVDPTITVERELKEETGLSAKKYTELLRMHTSNSVTDELAIAYVAEGLSQGETDFEETEDLRIKKLPLKEAVSMVMEGAITDSLSMAALLKLDRLQA